MNNQIHDVCQRMSDHYNKTKEKYKPILKEEMIKIAEALTKTKIKEEKVQRYDLCKDDRGFVDDCIMKKSKNGAYVLYDDYLKLEEKYKFLKEHPTKPLEDWLDNVADHTRKEIKKIAKELKDK